MTQEQKEFLLKDLCARLPYGVKFKSENIETALFVDTSDDEVWINGTCIDDFKPYLFPLSSMTDEQKQYLKNRFCYDWNNELHDLWICQIEIGDVDGLIDWFHKNHIDYRCLIEESLALDATGLGIY